MNKYIKTTLVLFALISQPAFGDMFQPSHSCMKPSKPYSFNSQWEIDSFKDDVDRYKRCISDFVDEMNDAAQHHQDAASDAIDEWNSFVNYELN